MTTIACDGKSMAADGLVCEGDVITQTDYVKIRKLADGRIVGYSGNAYNADVFSAWIEDGCTGELPKGLVDEDFGCVILASSGELSTFDAFGRSFIERAPYAIGSGRRFALSAMDMGKTPEEAVVYACTRDIFSGGVVVSLDRATILRSAA